MARWMIHLLAIEQPLSEKMAKAGLNTIISIGIVFLVLLLISFIISLFRYINRIEAKIQKQKPKVSAPVIVQTEEYLDEEEILAEEDFEKEEELAAAIIAAITAYEAEQGVALEIGDLRVRSIRKIRQKRV